MYHGTDRTVIFLISFFPLTGGRPLSSDKATAIGQTTPTTDDKTSAPPPKKKRSPTELAITWGVIALLLLAVLNELRAQNGYKSSIAAIEANLIDKPSAQALTLKDARALMVMWPMESRGNEDKRDVAVFRWFSPFKKYEILCALDSIEGENPRLISVGTRQPPQEDMPEFVAWTIVNVPESAADDGSSKE